MTAPFGCEGWRREALCTPRDMPAKEEQPDLATMREAADQPLEDCR